jgi:hypothetical protein
MRWLSHYAKQRIHELILHHGAFVKAARDVQGDASFSDVTPGARRRKSKKPVH